MTKKTAETVSGKRRAFDDYFAPISTHILLVVGIIFFNWDIGKILFLYVIEVAVIHVLFVTVALFAAQPVDGHDVDKWQEEPEPVTVISVLPPVYLRNTNLVGKYMFFGFIYILPFLYAIVEFADRSLSSLFSPTISLTVLAICVIQLSRVWRQFLADQWYRERSPAEAIRAGLWPLHELIVVVLFICVPVTFTLVLRLEGLMSD